MALPGRLLRRSTTTSKRGGGGPGGGAVSDPPSAAQEETACLTYANIIHQVETEGGSEGRNGLAFRLPLCWMLQAGVNHEFHCLNDESSSMRPFCLFEGSRNR